MNVLTSIIGPQLTTAGADLLAEVTAAVGPALVVAVPVLGIFVGFKIFKRLSRG